jgi:4-amino-4-deoxy-L-arabinose transferase and related glycosyltransferases of PMT family
MNPVSSSASPGHSNPRESFVVGDANEPKVRGDDRLDRVFLVAVFVAALVANFYFVTYNWKAGFLIGHEFRQAQTAMIAEYIDKQNNFSLRYETPLFGKPWLAPLEFPLYQWAVVGVSRATGWPRHESARAVGVASLYLALPAVYLLLGRAGLRPVRRLLPLALILATPVYIFYSRSFLMDVTTMMFSVWFLACFVEAMKTRRFGWLVGAALTGAAAGLIKSLVFFVWLFPAFLFGAWCLWQDFRNKRGGRAMAETIAWGVGAVVVPAVAVTWWVKFTDAIKEANPSTVFMTSKNLTQGNFGMYELGARVSRETWHWLLECWSQAIAQPWVIGVLVIGGAAMLRGERWRVLGAAGLFLAAQMMFPYAYAYQDYYFIAAAVFVVCAFGFVANGWFGSRAPRWLRWILVLVPFAPMYHTYARYYFDMQRVRSDGGTGLTHALRDYLPRGTVLIIAGTDWAAIIPYYAKHKALMIRNGLETDVDYLTRAFETLEDEHVSALVLVGDQRGNKTLRDLATKRFDLEATPTFSHTTGDVYVSNLYRDIVSVRAREGVRPEGISAPHNPNRAQTVVNQPMMVTRGMAEAMFSLAQPAPERVRLQFGYDIWWLNDVETIAAHPDADLWIPAPAGAKEVEWHFGIRQDAYERSDPTNGVEFIVDIEGADGTERRAYHRVLDPAARPQDRGLQREVIPIQTAPGERVVLRTRSNGSYSFDWAYWVKINVR